MVALSSAEAELYATCSASSEGLGLAAMCEEYGHVVTPWIHVDASAAIGIAQRKGLGRVRHLSTQSLRIQDAVREKRITLEKVNGSENPADLFTKHVPADLIERHMQRVGLQPRDGRRQRRRGVACLANAAQLVGSRTQRRQILR